MDILELRKRQITLEPFCRASHKSYHAHLPVIGINIVVLFRWLENCGRFELNISPTDWPTVCWFQNYSPNFSSWGYKSYRTKAM